MQVLLRFLVDLLGLPIGLWVVCCGGVQLHVKEVVQLMGELGHELRSMVQDIGIRQAMQLPDILSVEVGSLHGGVSGVSRNEVCSLIIKVYNHHNGIIPMHIWKLDDEVHQGYAPLFDRNWERVELTHGELVTGFCP